MHLENLEHCVPRNKSHSAFPGRGYLTIETLKGILLELEPKLTEEQLAEIVDEVDEDGSGTIDFDGLCRQTDGSIRKTPSMANLLAEFMEMMIG